MARPTGYALTRRLGYAVAGEDYFSFTPLTDARGDGRDEGVLLLHGANDVAQYADVARHGSNRIGPSLARAGFVCVAGTMGGNSFGNATAMGHVQTYWDKMVADYDVSSARVHLVGTSMGGYAALRWATLNPAKVASLSLLLPLCDIDEMYQNDTAGMRASIGAAWGVTYPEPLPTASDLYATAATLAGAGFPIKFWYEDSDTFVPPQTVLDMHALTGGSAQETPGTGGHTEVTMAQIDTAEILANVTA